MIHTVNGAPLELCSREQLIEALKRAQTQAHEATELLTKAMDLLREYGEMDAAVAGDIAMRDAKAHRLS